MIQDNKRNVTVSCDRVPVSNPRGLVSRPHRESWLLGNGRLETLIFADSGVYPINLGQNALGPALDVWHRDPELGPGRQPYEFAFAWDYSGSAVWDPWTERIIFTCGFSELLSLDAANEVTVLVDFAEAARGSAPSNCDLLVLDPQHRGRLWVVAGTDPDNPNGDDSSNGVYEVDLNAVLAVSPGPPSARSASPAVSARRLAELQEPLFGAVFDPARRRLLLATGCAVYGLRVDLPTSGGGDAADGDGDVELEALVDVDGPLVGVTGLAGGAADGSVFVVESVLGHHVRSRAGVSRSTVRRLELGTGSDAAADGAAAGGSSSGGGGGGGATADRPALTTLATADGTVWSEPHVLPDGRLAVLDAGDVGEVLLLPLLDQPPHATPPPNLGRPPPGAAAAAACCPPLPLGTLATDLGSLLDACQEPDAGAGADWGADMTLVAAGGAELRAHAGLLMARCDYFRPLLGGGFGDSGSRRLQLPDVEPAVLRCVLRHIYTGAADLEPLLEATHLSPLPPLAAAAAAAAAGSQQHPQKQQEQDEAVGSGSDAAGADPLRALAEAADRLLLPELSRAAQAAVLRRCEAAPPQHLVAGLLWAEARGFGRLAGALKELYMTHVEGLEAAEKAAAAAGAEPRRRGRSHGQGHGNGGGVGGGCCAAAGGGVGPRRLAACNPALAAELEEEVAARKRRRAA